MPRGGSRGDGVKSVTVNFVYYCQPLDVGMKEYTVCIALEKKDHDYLYRYTPIGKFYCLKRFSIAIES